MSILFEPVSIHTLRLANRFVRSATWEGLARDDGSPAPALTELIARLARGGVGLILTSHAYVSREGQAGPWQLGVYSDALLSGLAEMTDAVHSAGGRIAMQIAHAGSRAASRLSGLEPIGPSPVQSESGPAGREMSHHDIEAVVEAFAAAAVRAKKTGFDAVQIHAAHGYLLSQFLSPYFNKRTDAYGGSIENRVRLPREVLKGVLRVVGPDFPVMIKINSEDFLPGGLTVDDMLRTVMLLEQDGVHAIEMSGGTFLSGKFNPSRRGKPGPGEPEAYYEAAARRYRQTVRTPLMLVGGVRTFETAERLVAERVADYISLCRPLIREPGLVNRWKSQDRSPARCLSDSGCFKPAMEGRGVSCVLESGSN